MPRTFRERGEGTVRAAAASTAVRRRRVLLGLTLCGGVFSATVIPATASDFRPSGDFTSATEFSFSTEAIDGFGSREPVDMNLFDHDIDLDVSTMNVMPTAAPLFDKISSLVPYASTSTVHTIADVDTSTIPYVAPESDLASPPPTDLVAIDQSGVAATPTAGAPTDASMTGPSDAGPVADVLDPSAGLVDGAGPVAVPTAGPGVITAGGGMPEIGSGGDVPDVTSMDNGPVVSAESTYQVLADTASQLHLDAMTAEAHGDADAMALAERKWWAANAAASAAFADWMCRRGAGGACEAPAASEAAALPGSDASAEQATSGDGEIASGNYVVRPDDTLNPDPDAAQPGEGFWLGESTPGDGVSSSPRSPTLDLEWTEGFSLLPVDPLWDVLTTPGSSPDDIGLRNVLTSPPVRDGDLEPADPLATPGTKVTDVAPVVRFSVPVPPSSASGGDGPGASTTEEWAAFDAIFTPEAQVERDRQFALQWDQLTQQNQVTTPLVEKVFTAQERAAFEEQFTPEATAEFERQVTTQADPTSTAFDGIALTPQDQAIFNAVTVGDVQNIFDLTRSAHTWSGLSAGPAITSADVPVQPRKTPQQPPATKHLQPPHTPWYIPVANAASGLASFVLTPVGWVLRQFAEQH